MNEIQDTKNLIEEISILLLCRFDGHPSEKNCRAAVVYASTALLNMEGILNDKVAERITEEEREEIAMRIFKLEW